MADYTLQDLEEGIRAADAAGDAEAVQKLGAEYMRMQSAQAAPKAVAKPSAKPTSAIEKKAKDIAEADIGAMSELASGAIKGIVTPGRGLMSGLAETASKGIAEAGLGMATGLAGSVVGGLRGLGSALGREGEEEAARKVTETQEAMTYQPRSKMGEAVSKGVAAPLELASYVLGKGGGAAGEVLAGPKGRAAGETFGEAIPQIAATVLPIKGIVKGMKKPVETLPPATAKERLAAKAQELGYVLPPSEANPTLLNRLITGWGGKIQTEQAASIKNQPVTNQLAKKALGIPKDKDLSPELLDHVRTNAGRAYRAVKESDVPIRTNPKYEKAIDDLSQDWSVAEKDYPELAKNKSAINDLKEMLKKEAVSPTGAIEMVKDLRASAKDNFRAFNDPSKVALARAQRTAADALDTLIEDNLKMAEKPELVAEYKKARELIAKSYDVEAALNDATGNVNAIYLGKLLKKRPLSGELKDIAKFARTFEKSAKLPETIGAHPGVSPLDIAVAGIEAVPALASGRPGLAASALGMAAGRPMVRAAGLSEAFQKRGASATRTDIAKRRKEALTRGAPAGAVGGLAAQEDQIPMEEAL